MNHHLAVAEHCWICPLRGRKVVDVDLKLPDESDVLVGHLIG